MSRTMMTLLLALVALAGFSPPAGAQAAASPPHVHVRLIPQHSSIAAGGTMLVAIEETIEPGWHTYWLNPGDSGVVPEINWTLPAGFTAGAIQWPVPEKIAEGPLISYGYQEKATLLQPITAPQSLPAGPINLSVSINLLVCHDICVPEQGVYPLTLNAPGVNDDNTAVIAAAQAVLPQPRDWPATFREDDGRFALTLRPPAADLAALKAAGTWSLLPVEWGAIDNDTPEDISFTPDHMTLWKKKSDKPLQDFDRLHMLLVYQQSGDGNFDAVALQALPDPAWKNSAAPPPAVTTTATVTANVIALPSATAGVNMPLAKALLLALVGGIILNLMPCVFPVLSLKALKLCKLSGADLNEARRHSLLYTAGILASFLALAFALAALRQAGQQIGWGFQLQNPAFVLPLSWLLFVIGLSLSGFFEFGAGFANVGSRWVQGHGYAVSFFTGVLAAIVATPCTAPFMGVALGYALTQPPAIMAAVLLALGLGLALPLLVLSFFPAARRWLPKPGGWMVTFRELLAFPLYASAAWLVWVFSLQAGSLSVLIALSGAVVLAFGLWLLKKASGQSAQILRVLALLCFIAAAALIPLGGRMQAQTAKAADAGDWMPYTADGFATLENGDNPIFVDMTAAWCITCKLNENAVLDTAAVNDMFTAHHVQLVRGDWTNQNPDITAFLARHGRNGVPLYVYYGPRDATTKQRPDPVVLPQLLTPGILENALDEK